MTWIAFATRSSLAARERRLLTVETKAGGRGLGVSRLLRRRSTGLRTPQWRSNLTRATFAANLRIRNLSSNGSFMSLLPTLELDVDDLADVAEARNFS